MYYSKYNKYKKKYLELCNIQCGGNNILLEYNSIKDDITFKIKSLELNIEFDFVPQFVNDLCNKKIFVLFNTIIDLQKFCDNLKRKFIISEDIKINPQKPFSIYKKKLFDELINKTHKHNVIFNWPRLFYVYGPYQKKTSLIPMLIDSYLNNKEPNIKSPYNKNDFIFIDDVVKILIFMLQSSLPSGVYNVGTGVATEVIELSNIIKNFFNSNNLKKNIKKIADEQTINFFADTNKLKKYFSNLEFEKINSGLCKTIKFFTTKE